MFIDESFGFWFGVVGMAIGIFSFGIAIYQWAVTRANQKHNRDIQHVLAVINNSALKKQHQWDNQISTLQKLESSKDGEVVRLCLRAKDDFAEIGKLAIALRPVNRKLSNGKME